MLSFLQDEHRTLTFHPQQIIRSRDMEIEIRESIILQITHSRELVLATEYTDLVLLLSHEVLSLCVVKDLHCFLETLLELGPGGFVIFHGDCTGVDLAYADNDEFGRVGGSLDLIVEAVGQCVSIAAFMRYRSDTRV